MTLWFTLGICRVECGILEGFSHGFTVYKQEFYLCLGLLSIAVKKTP